MKVLNALLQLTSTAIFTHARGIFTLLITAVAVNVCAECHMIVPITNRHLVLHK